MAGMRPLALGNHGKDGAWVLMIPMVDGKKAFIATMTKKSLCILLWVEDIKLMIPQKMKPDEGA